MSDHSHADSAGVPWEGRRFEANTSAADDGSAPPEVIQALEAFRAGTVGESAVVDALRGARVLVPLIAQAGDEGHTDSGLRVDKTQELSLVTVMGPDGRVVQPAFTSVAAMAKWNPDARPIPVTFVNVAVSTASEGTDVVILDPTDSTEFVIRRPALWAVAQSLPWAPSYLDTVVLEAFMDAAEPEPAVEAVQLAPGDPTARLEGPELVVYLTLAAGLDRAGLDSVLSRMRDRWAESEIIANRVDSLGLRVGRAE